MEQAIKRKPNVHAFLYIYRNHASGFWWCAVPYVDSQGRRRQRRRSFRDARLGGKSEALKAARAWRDQAITDPRVRVAMGDRRPLVLYAGDDSGRIGDGGNPFGLVGVTATFREKPLGGNFSVTANRGRKKWFSMRRYGGYGAFKRAVLQRCKWVGAPVPDDDELRHRYQHWARDNAARLRRHGLEP